MPFGHLWTESVFLNTPETVSWFPPQQSILKNALDSKGPMRAYFEQNYGNDNYNDNKCPFLVVFYMPGTCVCLVW